MGCLSSQLQYLDEWAKENNTMIIFHVILFTI